jgi:putative hydrolase of the HAD superfamily
VNASPQCVRVVFFDAVGTLIHPVPTPAEVYGTFGREHGATMDVGTIGERFGTAFRRQETLDRQGDLRTSEPRERQRWGAIVREVFTELRDTEALFEDLWKHFAEPSAWTLFPDVIPCLTRLRRSGLRLGVASNFDGRLRRLIAGIPELGRLDCIVISSEIGWCKPAPGFFAAMLEISEAAPQDVLFVGDNLRSDIDGGRWAGVQTLFLDRSDSETASPSIRSLREVPVFLGLSD